jgi:uncharacterized protein (UPF0147 family)
MDNAKPRHEQQPDRMLAGALAHLAQHMESACPRAAYLAAMLLEQVAADPRSGTHLRQHALQLVEILERDPAHSPAHTAASDYVPEKAASHTAKLGMQAHRYRNESGAIR